MKKFISMFLGGLLFFSSSGLGNVFAGGKNCEKTLSDGTKLIYISTDNIDRKLDEYNEEYKRLLEQEYSKNQSLVMKGVSLAAAAVCFGLSTQIDSSVLSYSSQAVSCILGGLSFVFPDCHNSRLREREENLEVILRGLGNWRYHLMSEEQKNAFLRQYKETYGKEHYYEHFGDILRNNKPEEDGSGVVIVLRPKTKSKVGNIVRSHVYSQYEFDEKKGVNGYSILKMATEIGW